MVHHTSGSLIGKAGRINSTREQFNFIEQNMNCRTDIILCDVADFQKTLSGRSARYREILGDI